MIAQDGTLTSGTLRNALDITGLKGTCMKKRNSDELYTDDFEIYEALRRVHLLEDSRQTQDSSNPFADLDSFVAIGM